jgi:uncharacterized membrane protein YagU involved in acid resistance
MVTVQFDWKAATWSGVIAGLVFLMLEMFLVPVVGGGSPWGPPRMMAAIVLGKGVLPPPATFAPGIVLVALVLHLVLSIGYAVVFALVTRRLGRSLALGGGVLGGLVLYLVNFYGFTAVFPWFAMARNGITLFSHLVFGLVAAGAYRVLTHRHHHDEKLGNAPLGQQGI